MVPELMHILPGTWCLAWGNIYVNGKVVNKQFLSQTTLDTLKVSGGVQYGYYMYMCKYHDGLQEMWVHTYFVGLVTSQ